MSGPELILATTALSVAETLQQGHAARARNERAARAAEQQAAQARRRAASLRARLARAGVSAEGTPLDVLGQAAADAEFEALRELQAGEEAAFGRLSRARDARGSARSATRRANLRAGSRLLRGASDFGRRIR